MIVSYFTKQSLIEANNDAILNKRNRSLNNDFITSLDDDTKFPVLSSMDHNEQEVRLELMTDPATKVWLDVSYDTFKRNAQVLIDNTKFAESKNKNLARGKNKLKSSASGYYQFLEGSVPTAYNRATNRFFTGEQSKIFQPILNSNDSSAVSESIQDSLFLSNMFESKGSDRYLTPALFEGNKEASMNAYLYNHHTLSSKEKSLEAGDLLTT